MYMVPKTLENALNLMGEMTCTWLSLKLALSLGEKWHRNDMYMVPKTLSMCISLIGMFTYELNWNKYAARNENIMIGSTRWT